MRFSKKVILILVLASFVLAACAPKTTPQPTEVITELTEAPVVENQQTEAVVEAESDPFAINPADYSGDITMAGSSTVYPVSEKIVEMFNSEGYEGMGIIKLDSVGSGAGFERFCVSGETDIANASRGIKDSEVESCLAINRTPIEFRVGTDALAIVVNSENNFATDVTLEELSRIFSSDAAQWSDVRAEWPAEDIHRYVPGTDSGTYDFFIEVVMQEVYGKETGEQMFLDASNLQASEDDNVLVQGVSGDPYAIGFFGFAYYSENANVLNILSINGISPSFESAESGDYPLARPLFIYSDAAVMAEKPQVSAFIAFYLANVSDMIGEVGYFPASEEAMEAARNAWLEAFGQ